MYKDRFWFVRITLGKFYFLAQFPVNNLSHSLKPVIVFFLYSLVTFTYYVIDCFISIITYNHLDFLFQHIINFSSEIINSYGFNFVAKISGYFFFSSLLFLTICIYAYVDEHTHINRLSHTHTHTHKQTNKQTNEHIYIDIF